jgi:hypothetical protein
VARDSSAELALRLGDPDPAIVRGLDVSEQGFAVSDAVGEVACVGARSRRPEGPGQPARAEPNLSGYPRIVTTLREQGQ